MEPTRPQRNERPRDVDDDARYGDWDADEAEITPDEELEAWLIAREAELEERAFALADLVGEGWPR